MKTITAFLMGFALGALAGISMSADAGSLQNFAQAQSICGNYDGVLKHLEKSYGEVPQFRALTTAGLVLTVLIAPDDSWTILLTRPDGITCFTDTGESWGPAIPRVKGPKT